MMNSWKQFRKISQLENNLYGGPEMPEQVFEREDSFSADHPRRRQLKASFLQLGALDQAQGDANTWYVQSFDEAKHSMIFEMPLEAGKTEASDA